MNTKPTALVGPNAPNWGGSRLSKTNRAHSPNGRSQRSIPESRKRPLTDRDGITLRTEVRQFSSIGDRSVSWDLATDRWRNYILDNEDVQSVFENCAGERVRGSKPHRFSPEYADKQYAKLKDLERGISEAYGKRLHTAMLTFTASSTDDSGNPLPQIGRAHV